MKFQLTYFHSTSIFYFSLYHSSFAVPLEFNKYLNEEKNYNTLVRYTHNSAKENNKFKLN